MRLGFVFRILMVLTLVPRVFVLGQASSQSSGEVPARLALTHVTLVDVRDGTTHADTTVLIAGDRIESVGPTSAIRLPKHTRVVNAGGQFLIPGLWDMHVHALWDADRARAFLPLFLANGVTGVREMGGPMPVADQVRWRQDVAKGSVLGPRLVIAGPFVDGPHAIWPGSVKVSTAEEGRQAVDSLQSAGVDFIKVYSQIPRAAYLAIAEEARKDRIPFVGHVPLEVDVSEASTEGQKSIEHLMGILLHCSSKADELKADLMRGVNINQLNDQMVDTYDPEKAATLFALFVKNGTWHTPTLTIRHARPYLQELQAEDDSRLKYIPKSIVDGWVAKDDKRQPASAEVAASRKRLFQKETEVVGAMRRAGVRFLAGTDTPNPFCFPGFSLHDELGFMVKAGFTPLEALQASTINPAEFLGLSDSLGTIEKSKIADLVLLEADPLKDIANTKKITAVITNGRFLDRTALDGLLAVAASAAGH
jgi:imidazolonepropionase-like amidohydrolase